MAFIEVRQFNFQQSGKIHDVHIRQNIDLANNLATFLIEAETGEVITMEGVWDSTLRRLIRSSYYSNKMLDSSC